METRRKQPPMDLGLLRKFSSNLRVTKRGVHMNNKYYKKALEIIINHEEITMPQLYQALIDLNIEKKEVLSTINKIIESPLVIYRYNTFKIIQND